MRSIWLAGILLVGCAGTPPIEEYSLARTALIAAKQSGAASLAPGFFYKAEENYRQGQLSFKNNDNEEAKEYFKLSKAYSEKAENATRLKKFEGGGY